MRKFTVELVEAVYDDYGGYFCVNLLDSDTGEVLDHSDVIDNLGDALDTLSTKQREWYDSYRVDARVDDWRIKVDVGIV